MTARAGAAATSGGVRHLAALAHAPRPAGGAAEARAREYAAAVLRGAGFAVAAEPFSYSAFPGRWATPVGGAMVTTTIVGAAWLALGAHAPRAALAVLTAGVSVTILFARHMLGDAVLDLPLLRASSENLVATRGRQTPRVWLVAHLDSKSQPVPSAARVAGAMLLALAVVLALASATLQLTALPHRMSWWVALAAALLGAPAVMGSVVGSRSEGAVDNASGVAAVLEAALRARSGTALGVLLPSAEELGMAGARAWARNRAAATALNCDGVDDDGAITIMYSGVLPEVVVTALRDASASPVRVRRMPFGLLTDSVALVDRGWRAVTVSRGSFATLRRVHTRGDSLVALRGDGIDEVASLLARAAEALA